MGKWIACALALMLAGCATSKTELMSQDEHYYEWAVPASVESVFKAYKNHAEEEYSFTGFLGDRLETVGHFYGNNAELSVRMVGNPLARVTYLHILMAENDANTEVQAWAYNSPWANNIGNFKELEP